MALTKVVRISPDGAAAAGCTAFCQSYVEDGQQVYSYTDTDEKGYTYFTNYYFWAKGTRKWRFRRFTFDQEQTSLNKDGTTRSSTSNLSRTRNPSPTSLSITSTTLPSDYHSQIPSNHSQGMYSGSFTNVVAEFVYYANDPTNQYYIETESSPAGGGLTFGDGWFYSNSTCRLKAVANPGYEFSHWSDGSTDPEITFAVNSNATYTAYFDGSGEDYTVTTKSKYDAGGTTTGGGTYSAGTTITLTATPNQGYQFAGWTSSAGETNANPSFPYTVSSDVTWTAYFGTGRLIYFDYSGTPLVPGDATVTVDFDPKLWTCEEYGQDHAVTLTVTPSWSAPSTISNQQEFPLTKSTLEGGSTFTIGFTANTHCDAGVYPEITAIVVIQQMNVGTFTIEVPLTVGTQSMSTITASNGRVISLN